MWKRFQEVLLLLFLRQRRNLFVENFIINRICPSGATLRFSALPKLFGCAAGAGFALVDWQSYKQVTPHAKILLH